MAELPIRNNLVLELHVPSFTPAHEFYCMFGFEEIDYDAASDDGKSGLGYLVLRRKDSIGDTLLNFYGDREGVWHHSHFRQFPKDTPRGYGVEITIPVGNVQQLWDDVLLKLDHSVISQPLETKRWDKRDFRVVDPYGFYIRFTELVDWGQE